MKDEKPKAEKPKPAKEEETKTREAKDNAKEPFSQLENGGSDAQSNHSMLGTIKARRGVNGRAEMQSNLSSIATNGLVRAVKLKARNITRSLPILSDLSSPPSPKKRKLT